MAFDKRYWEAPEVDLNFRHYSGHPSDAIKLLKRNIENYLRKPNILKKDIEVYSAIYNALDYYKSILYSSASDFSTGPTFLNHSLINMKKDYDYLSQKYNSNDITQPAVITMNGRIKSPISALEKIKDKVEEYIENNGDLRFLNESLRDFMGVRIIVNPPLEVKNLGKAAEYRFLQNVLEDLLQFHGVQNPSARDPYKFIPINTKNNPNKLEKIRSDGKPDNLPDYLVPIVKNYVDHPKKSGYQSYHICATPQYSSEVKRPIFPPYIIPPMQTGYSFEYQIRTSEMNEVAEHGSSSHDDYKEIGNYHRLSIPFYIELNKEQNKFKSLNLEESCKKHFGYVPFLRIYDTNGIYLKNISLIDFRDLFTSSERDEIIDGKKRIYYYPDYGGFGVSSKPDQLAFVENYIAPIFLTIDELNKLKFEETPYEEILDESNATDNIISSSTQNISSIKPKVEVYVVETSDDRKRLIEKTHKIDEIKKSQKSEEKCDINNKSER